MATYTACVTSSFHRISCRVLPNVSRGLKGLFHAREQPRKEEVRRLSSLADANLRRTKNLRCDGVTISLVPQSPKRRCLGQPSDANLKHDLPIKSCTWLQYFCKQYIERPEQRHPNTHRANCSSTTPSKVLRRKPYDKVTSIWPTSVSVCPAEFGSEAQAKAKTEPAFHGKLRPRSDGPNRLSVGKITCWCIWYSVYIRWLKGRSLQANV